METGNDEVGDEERKRRKDGLTSDGLSKILFTTSSNSAIHELAK